MSSNTLSMLEVCGRFWMCSAYLWDWAQPSSLGALCPRHAPRYQLPSVWRRVSSPSLLKRKVWKGVVYKVPAANEIKCMWVDETGRTLQEHLCEHKAEVKKSEQKNGLAVHAWEMRHQVNWVEAMVIRLSPISWKGEYWRHYTSNSVHTPPTWTVASPSIQSGSPSWPSHDLSPYLTTLL